MPQRARDWLNQAIRDLEQAEDLYRAERHEWACFAAQQAAEKAVKALHLHHGQEAWGHVIARLLRELARVVPVPEELVEKGRVLDNFYIPLRYPNSHPEGAPFEHYGPLHSEEALRYAREILETRRCGAGRNAWRSSSRGCSASAISAPMLAVIEAWAATWTLWSSLSGRRFPLNAVRPSGMQLNCLCLRMCWSIHWTSGRR
ncbi:MAG: hypothetical protein C4309_03290 [Chloroflexota bacterium]